MYQKDYQGGLLRMCSVCIFNNEKKYFQLLI